MIKKLLPLVLILAGLGAGVGAGVALKKPADDTIEAEAGHPCGDVTLAAAPASETPPIVDLETDFIKLPDQFVVPVVADDRVKALVVMSLTLEVDGDREEAIFSRIPKLRDGFLRVILDHANTGGFDGAFTGNGSMDVLRRGFMEVARQEFPQAIRDVLILDINRQDLI